MAPPSDPGHMRVTAAASLGAQLGASTSLSRGPASKMAAAIAHLAEGEHVERRGLHYGAVDGGNAKRRQVRLEATQNVAVAMVPFRSNSKRQAPI